MGAAAIAVARVVSLIIGLAYAHRQLGRYVTPAYDLRPLVPAAFASAALAAGILVPQIFYSGVGAIPVYATVGGVAFVLIIRRAVHEEDLSLLGELLRGRAGPLERLARRVFSHPARA